MKFKELCLLVYDSRSGSTFFSKEISKVRGVEVSVESNLIKVVMQSSDGLKDLTPSEMYEYLQKSGRVAALDVSKELFMKHYDRLKGLSINESIIIAFYSAHLERRSLTNTEVLIVKDGANGYYLNLIEQIIPIIKIIFIVRDGRAVLNSKLKTPKVYEKRKNMARDPLSAARAWASLIESTMQYKTLNPKSVLVLHYEDYISDLPKWNLKVTDFLGVEHVLRYESNYVNAIPEEQKKIHPRVLSAENLSRVDAWRYELPELDRLLFEKHARTQLIEMGYSNFIDDAKFAEMAVRIRIREIYCMALRVLDWFGYLVRWGKLYQIINDKSYHSSNTAMNTIAGNLNKRREGKKFG